VSDGNESTRIPIRVAWDDGTVIKVKARQSDLVRFEEISGKSAARIGPETIMVRDVMLIAHCALRRMKHPGLPEFADWIDLVECTLADDDEPDVVGKVLAPDQPTG
jgi:hypothetical protein